MTRDVCIDRVAVIGFGEAGPVVAGALRAGAGAEVVIYDILSEGAETAAAVAARARAAGVELAMSPQAALEDATLIVSLVTASAAEEVAHYAIGALRGSPTWLDLNSVGPATKRRIAETVAKAGGSLVEGVAMDTVPARGAKVPVLLCGPRAGVLADALNAAGMNAASLGADYGQASTVKLCRSIVVKGLEALVTEAVQAAACCGVRETMLDSLAETFPSLDWPLLERRFAERISRHGKRRAEEMTEAADMLDDMGLDSSLCAVIAAIQRRGALQSR